MVNIIIINAYIIIYFINYIIKNIFKLPSYLALWGGRIELKSKKFNLYNESKVDVVRFIKSNISK